MAALRISCLIIISLADRGGLRAWRAAVRYLIDGNNLLHAVGSHGPAGAVGRETLCRLLGRWAGAHLMSVTVIFDGPAPSGDLARQMQVPGLDVHFSGPRSADAVIEEEVGQASAPGLITVVTTDRAIQHAARYRRARCVDSEAFVAQLYASPDDSPTEAADSPEKPADISAAETRQWLREFGGDLEAPFDDTDEMME